jgi:molecular chaperone DnaK (HSP70)
VDSGGARLLNASVGFRIVPQGEGRSGVSVRSGTFSAEEVAAIIVKHLRELAEAQFQAEIRKAVFTLPVTATPQVRDAMVRIGSIAGLEVVRLVSEPGAGAVANGFNDETLGDAPLLVYDFGGGTFDAAVIRRKGKSLTPVSTDGDEVLGGDDFDLAFARWVANGLYRSHGKDVTKDVVLWDQIQRQCELVKRMLSSSTTATYRLNDAFNIPGKSPNVVFQVDRSHMVPEWTPLVDRSLHSAAKAVAQAGLVGRDLGAVLIIGGTSQVALVKEGVARVFPGRSLIVHEPQTVVARGAAILGAHPELLAD